MSIKYFLAIISIKAFMKLFQGLKIIHPERLRSARNVIIAANHISANDPPYLGGIFPFEIYFLAKIELFRNKIFSRILQAFNAIPIRRGQADLQALREVQKRLDQGHSVVIFPEGTRRSNRPKAGIGMVALQAGKDILPILIENSNCFWACLFRQKRLTFTIGKIIPIADFEAEGKNKDNYQRIAGYVLDTIHRLKDER